MEAVCSATRVTRPHRFGLTFVTKKEENKRGVGEEEDGIPALLVSFTSPPSFPSFYFFIIVFVFDFGEDTIGGVVEMRHPLSAHGLCSKYTAMRLISLLPLLLSSSSSSSSSSSASSSSSPSPSPSYYYFRFVLTSSGIPVFSSGIRRQGEGPKSSKECAE